MPAECLPAADAGRPVRDAGRHRRRARRQRIGTAAPTRPPGRSPTYAWDLDDDGQYDDATGATPSLHARSARTGSSRSACEVTDAFGNTATDSAHRHGHQRRADGRDRRHHARSTSSARSRSRARSPTPAGSTRCRRPSLRRRAAPRRARRSPGERAAERHDDASRSTTSTATTAPTPCRCAPPTTTRPATATPRWPPSRTSTRRRRSTRPASRSTTAVRPSSSRPARTSPSRSARPTRAATTCTLAWDWGDGDGRHADLAGQPAGDRPGQEPEHPAARRHARARRHAYATRASTSSTSRSTDDDGGSATDTAARAHHRQRHGLEGPRVVAQPVPRQAAERLHAGASCSATSTSWAHSAWSSTSSTDASTRAAATHGAQQPGEGPGGRDLRPARPRRLAELRQRLGQASAPRSTPTSNGTLDSTFGAVMFTAETVSINPASTSAQIKAQKDIVERIAIQSGN